VSGHRHFLLFFLEIFIGLAFSLSRERARKRGPGLTTAEKNLKKVEAVDATREHGKQLFQEKNFVAAHAVYNRGVMICTGAYDVTDEQYAYLRELECLLDLNMAACRFGSFLLFGSFLNSVPFNFTFSLQLKENTRCIEECNMALNIDSTTPSNVAKAFYRIAQAYVAMSEFDLAEEYLEKAKVHLPSDAGIANQFNVIKVCVRVWANCGQCKFILYSSNRSFGNGSEQRPKHPSEELQRPCRGLIWGGGRRHPNKIFIVAHFVSHICVSCAQTLSLFRLFCLVVLLCVFQRQVYSLFVQFI